MRVVPVQIFVEEKSLVPHVECAMLDVENEMYNVTM